MPSPASAEATRRALIRAAQDHLARGALGVSVASLTNEAGVSVGSLYSHFKDRERLFHVAAAEVIAGYLPTLGRIMDAAPNPALGLVAFMFAYAGLPETNPRVARIIVNGGTAALNEVRHYSTEPSTRIRQAVSAGEIPPLDAEAFVLAVVGAFQMVITRQMSELPTADLPMRTALLFGHQLGYDDAFLLSYFGSVEMTANDGSNE